MARSSMVSLELTDEEKLDTACPVAVMDTPDYPWGTRITLNDAILEKFDCDIGDFKVGEVLLLKCVARVTGLSSDSTAMGPQGRLELQITDMAIMGEGEGENT